MSKFGAYLKTKDFRKTILLAVGSVIVVVLIAFFSLGFYTAHGTGIPVPKVKGLTIEEAINVLQEQGFNYQIDSVYQDLPPGTIVDQDPDQGTLVKENRTIYLTMVSRLAPNTGLPNLEQMPFITAEATLKSYGLKLGDTTYVPDIARDMVLAVKFGGQVIRPGVKIPKGSKIDLVLGNGEGAAEVDIPDLVGEDLDAAKFALRGSGLQLGTVMRQGTVTDTSNAYVVDQYPKRVDTLSKVPAGTRINVTISQTKKNEPN